MKKIFLTGSKGFIGSHLLKKLHLLGYEVVTDLRYLHTQKYFAVIHLASKNNIKNEFDPDLIESNIILTKEIFKVPSRIIYASSCVAANPLNPYAFSKLYSEHLGGLHGNAVGLRFHNVYGTGNNKGIVKFLIDQPDGTRIKIRGPELVRDYIYVEDVVGAIIKNIPSFEEIIFTPPFCKSGRCVSIKQSVLNNKVKYVGTGVATETMDLVNLYMKLSGKNFIIDVEDAGVNEPKKMVSNTLLLGAITLEQGLLKMINENTDISTKL